MGETETTRRTNSALLFGVASNANAVSRIWGIVRERAAISNIIVGALFAALVQLV